MNIRSKENAVSILFISSISGIGGAEFSMVELVEHLDRDVYAPKLYVSGPGLLAQTFVNMKVPITYGDFPFFRKRNPFEYFKALFRLILAIKKQHIRLLQVNCDRAVPMSVIAAKLTGVPCVCYIHDLLRAWYLPAYVRYLNQADCIIADSASVYNQCLNAGMRSDLLKVVYESVDTKRFSDVSGESRQKMRADLGFSDEDVVVGIVGKIYHIKGHEILLKAAALALKQAPLLRILVVGDNEMTGDADSIDRLSSLANDLGISNIITFLGYRDDVPEIMKSLDILAMPSLSEAFGRAAAEALASGIPVIATMVGGLPEIISDGITGFLIPPGNEKDLAWALINLYLDSDLRKAMGERGLASVKRFDVSEHVKAFSTIYSCLIKT